MGYTTLYTTGIKPNLECRFSMHYGLYNSIYLSMGYGLYTSIYPMDYVLYNYGMVLVVVYFMGHELYNGLGNIYVIYIFHGT